MPSTKERKYYRVRMTWRLNKWWQIFIETSITWIYRTCDLERECYISNLPILNHIQPCYFQYNSICYCAERCNTFKSEADCLWMSRMAGSNCLHSGPQTKTWICSLSVFHSNSWIYITNYRVSWELRQNLSSNFMHCQICSMAALSNVLPFVCAAGMILYNLYSFFRLCLFF